MHTDPLELIARDDLDAVAIATPPGAHAALAVAALRSGKHVLCEKPFALDANEAAAMHDAAGASGKTAMVGHEFRHAPQRAYIKELLADGYIGRFRFCTIELFLDRYVTREPRPFTWMARESEGGGVLGALGSHYIDGLRHWFGDITAASGRLSTLRPDTVDPATGAPMRAETDDTFLFTLEFESGGIATMTASFAATPSRGARIVVMGERGTLIAEQTGPNPMEDGVVIASGGGAPLGPLRRPAKYADHRCARSPSDGISVARAGFRSGNRRAGLAVAEFRRRPTLPAGDGRGARLVEDRAHRDASLRGTAMTSPAWPDLPYDAWKDTYETLHMWTQIVGKIRLALHAVAEPHVAGDALPERTRTHDGTHAVRRPGLRDRLRFRRSRARRANEPRRATRAGALEPMSVAQFLRRVMEALAALRMPVSDLRQALRSGDPIAVRRGRHPPLVRSRVRAPLLARRCSSADVLGRFRSRYYGKASPVHFFWGSFDLAVTRFSGRTRRRIRAAVPNLADRVTRDAYSHEVSSAGSGREGVAAPYPLFYSYAYPEPRLCQRDRGTISRALRRDAARIHLAVRRRAQADDPPRRPCSRSCRRLTRPRPDLGLWDRRALEVSPETLRAVGAG